MNKKVLLPLIVLLCIPFFIAGFSFDDAAEKEEVRKALENYFFKGKLESDKQLLSEIIHEDYRLFNVHKGRLEKYVRSDFFSWLGGKNDIKFKIGYIDITGGVAAVKVIEDAGNHMWVDYFNLVKVDGKWWIMDEVAFPLRK
ncbi:MAG: nuclear transport factor 2 family protein [Candidatus Aminicenantes bacterium]|nr:nuclear transport factor 2 family protein [Candidatus Aminicenantes bacterium]